MCRLARMSKTVFQPTLGHNSSARTDVPLRGLRIKRIIIGAGCWANELTVRHGTQSSLVGGTTNWEDKSMEVNVRRKRYFVAQIHSSSAEFIQIRSFCPKEHVVHPQKELPVPELPFRGRVERTHRISENNRYSLPHACIFCPLLPVVPDTSSPLSAGGMYN